jgi:glycosyltransferase involved in cell wall biosynthesis
MGRRRVAIDVRPLALPHVTGVGLLVRQILEELVGREYDFVAISDRPVPEGRLPAGTPVQVAPGAGGRIRWERGALPRLLRSLLPAPDLYHATWNHGVPRGLPFPSVLSLLDLIPWVHPEWVPWPFPPPLHRFLYRGAVRSSVREARAAVTLSEASRGDIATHLLDATERIEVVPCAVPRGFAQAAADPRAMQEQSQRWQARFGGKPYWLYLGGFDPRKGMETLLELGNATLYPGLTPDLVLAGAVNEFGARLERTAQERRYRMHFPGYIEDADLPGLFAGAALFLYPSRYEGFGIPPLLAMAAGVPCVVTDGGSLPEVVGDAAVVVPAGNTAAFASATLALTVDGERCAALAARGRARAAEFSAARLGERMTRVYARALEVRAGSA